MFEKNLKSKNLTKYVDMIFSTLSESDVSEKNINEIISESVNMSFEYAIKYLRAPTELRNDDVRNNFISELKKKYLIENGIKVLQGTILTSSQQNWIEDAIRNNRFSFESYSQYVKKLKKKNYSQESIENLNKTTSEILENLGDPRVKAKKFGLMMGDVQSGKTSTFTGICHKAVDSGYRLIIVLTGTTNTLRIQTQRRLDEDLTGQVIQPDGKRKNTEIQQRSISWNRITSVENDFIGAKSDTQIQVDTPTQVSLAVIKKNSSVLKNLLIFLKNNTLIGLNTLPLLLIDDEADNASINSNKENEDPTKINSQIRAVLDYFDHASYLAVTATPFANIFINPQIDSKTREISLKPTENLDLFPRDFIYALQPPKGYLGVERLFGELADLENFSFKYNCLIPMTINEETDSNNTDEALKIYEGKIKKPSDLNKLPENLIQAVLYFCCVCAYQDLGYQSNLSMLVHIARFTDVQHKLNDLISDYISSLKEKADIYWCDKSYPLSNDRIYQKLRSIWDDGLGCELYYSDLSHGEKPLTLKQLSNKSWDKIARKLFVNSIENIRVVEINSDSVNKNTAVYYEKNDARIIAIGGNSLSRGVTLEGLCVSYFSRRSPAYDTLLQMGRWFGYREKVKDYMKIWISDCLINSYEYIAEAVSEFRESIELMCRDHRSPKDFGLRIRTAPAVTKLIVTAACKRRYSKLVSLKLDLSGCPIQASTFPLLPEKRASNFQKIKTFIKSLGQVKRGQELYPDASSGKEDLVWINVNSSIVAKLIKELDVPSWSYNLLPSQIAQLVDERFENWTVRLLSLSKKEGNFKPEDVFDLGHNHQIVCASRTFEKTADWIQPKRRAVLTPSHFYRHWDQQKIQKVKSLTQEKDISPQRVLSERNEQPQLLIYAIRNNEAQICPCLTSNEILATVVLGLPRVDETSKQRFVEVKYETNQIWQQLQHGEGFLDKD